MFVFSLCIFFLNVLRLMYFLSFGTTCEVMCYVSILLSCRTPPSMFSSSRLVQHRLCWTLILSLHFSVILAPAVLPLSLGYSCLKCCAQSLEPLVLTLSSNPDSIESYSKRQVLLGPHPLDTQPLPLAATAPVSQLLRAKLLQVSKFSGPSKYGTQTSATSVAPWEFVESTELGLIPGLLTQTLSGCSRKLERCGPCWLSQVLHCLFGLGPAKSLYLPAIYFRHIIQ